MIRLLDIAIQQGHFSLDGIQLTIPAGSYSVLMGSSGSGKSTLLEIICGLRKPSAGRVELDGVDITTWRPAERNIGYVPQDRALFPGICVRDQIAFSLVLRNWEDEAIHARVVELASLLRIEPLLDRMPAKLSGGEAQRVALARALAPSPSVLCLDEPLSALDHDLHDEMTGLLKQIHSYAGVTVVHITHSRFESQRLATHSFRLARGKVFASGMD